MRKYNPQNVYEAALSRIEQVYNMGHRLVVGLSGGKDSTVVLELCIEVAKKLGKLPVEAAFRDEELLTPGTTEYLERMASRKEVSLTWFCNHNSFGLNVFDREIPFFWRFDTELGPKAWVTTPPKWAKWVEGSLMIDEIIHPEFYPDGGQDGFDLISVQGIRASESSMRNMAVYTREGLLSGYNDFNVRSLWPIYDWSSSDIWTAINSFKWDYNKSYDAMLLGGFSPKFMRIGQPTVSLSAAKQLKTFSQIWPEWFEKMCARLPGVHAAATYGEDFIDRLQKPGETWKQTYQRVCIHEAPPWIRRRSEMLLAKLMAKHARHSTTDIPMDRECRVCGPYTCWKKMTINLYYGDPTSFTFASFLSPVDIDRMRDAYLRRLKTGNAQIPDSLELPKKERKHAQIAA